MNMSTKQTVISLAEQMGVEVDVSAGGWNEVALYTPRGIVFNATDCHSAISAQWDDDKMADLWTRALRDLRYGLRPCDVDECDVCDEEGE